MHENTSTVGYDLFYKYVDLVFKIVKRMNFTSCDREDLIQAGLMGLHQATKKYDPSRNVKFSTYATYYIVGEIKKVAPGIIISLLDQGYIPVISPIAGSEDGESYNVNADTAAGILAGALKADKLLIL